MSDSRQRVVPVSDTGRVEAFSDGVLAIVITLLVLDLRPPDVDPGGLLSGLLAQWPGYLAYFTSFHYVAVIWLNHHATFRRVRFIDRPLHWANLGILFTTALLPFPTAVVSQALQREDLADARTAVGLYALVGVLLCASWLVFFEYVSRHPQLVEDDVEEGFFRRECTRAWAGIAGYVAAGVLGVLLVPLVGFVIFLCLTVFYGFTSHGLARLPYPRRPGRRTTSS
ncbi:MAG: TMEM175 family protein [Pseudonocardiaceae bacterium]